MARARFIPLLATAWLLSAATCRPAPDAKDVKLAEVHYDLCVNSFTYQRFEEALDNCNRAIMLNPYNYEAHNALGLVWWSKKDLDKAKAEFEKAVELKPEFADGWNNLGAIAIERNELGLARQSFDHALADPLYRTPYLARSNLGWVYHLQGDDKHAVELIQDALRAQADYCMGYKQLAQVQESMGQQEKADQSWSTFASLCPKEPEASYEAGRVRHRHGQLFEAAKLYLACISSARKLSPSHQLVKVCSDALNSLPALPPDQEEQLKKLADAAVSDKPDSQSHDLDAGGH